MNMFSILYKIMERECLKAACRKRIKKIDFLSQILQHALTFDIYIWYLIILRLYGDWLNLYMKMLVLYSFMDTKKTNIYYTYHDQYLKFYSKKEIMQHNCTGKSLSVLFYFWHSNKRFHYLMWPYNLCCVWPPMESALSLGEME